MRQAVAAEGDEGDLLVTGALDGARANDAAAVGVQDDLEQHGWRVGAGAAAVVAVARIEARQVEGVIDQVTERVLEGAAQKCRSRSTARNRGLVSICL